MKRKKISIWRLGIFYVLIFVNCTSIAFSFDDEVTVFDVGQGNCVLVKHKTQAILIDAGKSEHQFSTLYDRLFGYDKKRYRLQGKTVNQGIEVDTDDEEDSEASETSENPLITDKAPKGQQKCEEHVKKYTQQIIGSIWKKIPKIGDIKTLKAIVISHPDKDHYNLLPDIFNNKVNFKINTIILGGRFQQYTSDFQNWLKTHYYGKQSTKNISKVIFSGTIDGSKKKGASYARAYCSLFKDHTRTDMEKELETALQFDGEPGEKPEVKILAMNVGYKEPQDVHEESSKKEKDDSSNTSSIVLRIQNKKASFAITGDADGCTWDFVLASHLGETEALQTDYLLLSHHGALRHGPSRKDMLEIFKPRVCLISAGRFGNYHHPRGEIIERLQKLNTLKKFGKPYPFTHYIKLPGNEDPVRRRESYEEMICSTLDDGTITFDLIEPKKIKKICVSRNREKFIKPNEEEDFFFKNPIVKYSDIENLNSKKKKIIEEENKKGNKVKFFYKHSSQYDLILPEEDGITFNKGDVFYLIDLKGKKIYRIE